LYVEEVKKNGPRMYSSLKDEKLKLLDNNEVVLEFGNSAILDEFEQTYRQRAKYFLRRHLKNDFIELTIKITKENKKNTNILYTPQDKFKYLADKNPLIDKLRQDFNLDYE
jgi:DNA polymerase-3 subunit gamma/tau